MRTLKLVTLAMLVSFPLLSFADDAPANKSAAPKIQRMTCEEFTSTAEVDQPKLVYYALGHFQGGENYGMVDLVNTDKLVPVVVESCKATPKESFWKKFKAEVKKAM